MGRVVAQRPGGEFQTCPTLSPLRDDIPPHKGEGEVCGPRSRPLLRPTNPLVSKALYSR